MEIDRRTFLAGIGATAALAVVGCNRTSDLRTGPGVEIPRPTLRVTGLGGDWGVPSPFAALGAPGYWRTSFLYDTLLWKDGSGKLLPWLARRYQRSTDGLTYTFELREDLKWSDGRSLTADDVAFTFDYFAHQTLAPFVIAQPRGVSKVRATGNRGVEITLVSPDVTFAQLTAGALPIVPRHVWEHVTDAPAAQDLALLVGSGPYRLESYSEAEGSYLYEAKDDYFLGRPFVKRIEMAPVGSELQGLLAGELSAAEPATEGSRPDVLAPFRADGSFGIIERQSGFTFPLFFNVGRGGALGDVRFRRACAMAIDRGDMVERLLGGQGTPGSPGFLPPEHPHFAAVEQYPFDVDAANRLLDEAGYTRQGNGPRRGPDGRELRFELLGFGMPFPPSVELVVVALGDIGVEVKPVAADGDTFFPRTIFGNYDMAVSLFPGPSGGSVDGDPDILRQVFSSRLGPGPNRATGYSDGELDELAERQRQTFDVAKRKQMTTRMQEIIARDVAVLPLYYPKQFFIFRRQVFDQWYFTPGGFATGISEAYNKHALVTGMRAGLQIRSS